MSPRAKTKKADETPDEETTPTKSDPRRLRASFPWSDTSTNAWIDLQENFSRSMQVLIRESIMRDGYVDVVNRPVAPQPRRGRPPQTPDLTGMLPSGVDPEAGRAILTALAEKYGPGATEVEAMESILDLTEQSAPSEVESVEPVAEQSAEAFEPEPEPQAPEPAPAKPATSAPSSTSSASAGILGMLDIDE